MQNRFELDRKREYEFYAVYLLQSCAAGYNRHTYIGSTPDPVRRLRQHNSELKGGAKKTKRKQPWKLVLFVWGFMSKYDALQFEWAWQHPQKSRYLKQSNLPNSTAALCKPAQINRIEWSIPMLYELISSKRWSRQALNIEVLDHDSMHYWKQSFSLRPHQNISLIDLTPSLRNDNDQEDDLLRNLSDAIERLKLTSRFPPETVESLIVPAPHPSRNGAGKKVAHNSNNIECLICYCGNLECEGDLLLKCWNAGCNGYFHLTCLAKWFLTDTQSRTNLPLLPVSGECPKCRSFTLWSKLIQSIRSHRHAKNVPDSDNTSDGSSSFHSLEDSTTDCDL